MLSKLINETIINISFKYHFFANYKDLSPDFIE